MGRTRRHILTIAGFDPSGGAGVLADVKTFEQLKLQSSAVITANTIQTEDSFDSVNWIDEEIVMNQLKTLLDRYQFEVVKIGLIKSENQLNKILELLHQHNKKVKVIWDPILSASAGFEFHEDLKIDYSKVFLVTPNLGESEKLRVTSDEVRVFLKGGHSEDALGVDKLMIGDKTFKFKPKTNRVFEKHGSGCILSSAIAGYLAKGYPLNKACLRGKDYVTKALASNESKLAFHKT